MNQQSRTRVLGWLGGLICLSLLSPPITAQDWARDMFEITEHDFGTIARGAKAEYGITSDGFVPYLATWPNGIGPPSCCRKGRRQMHHSVFCAGGHACAAPLPLIAISHIDYLRGHMVSIMRLHAAERIAIFQYPHPRI